MHHYHNHYLDHHLILRRKLIISKLREKRDVLAKLQLVNWLGLKVETVNNFSGLVCSPHLFFIILLMKLNCLSNATRSGKE